MRTTRLILLVTFVVGILLPLSAAAQAKLPESKIKTVYITPLSHYDLGFVEPPDQVRERVVRHIDEVIRVAESDPDFRWTIESVWQVDEWLKRQRKPSSVLPSDKQKIERLFKLIRSGQIALSTSWGSMHTDFMGAEELNRLCYAYTSLHKSFNITSDLAVMDDVPGHPTSIPSVLADSGTKYLVTGANLFLNDATSLAPGKVPFYWESPDGSKVLTWISAGKRGGYVEGMTDFYLDPYSLDPYTDKKPFDMFNPELAGKKTDLEVMEIGMTELLNRYNNAGYNYDAVMTMYAHDFVEPSNVLNLLKAVDLWNKKHSEVKLKVATPNDFFKYIEGKYAAQLPTYRGEWSGLWSEAKTRSPRISAMARYAHQNTPAAETLWSALAMTRRVPAPVGNTTKLYDLMFGYDEHSGAGNNGWPQLNSVKPLEDQNKEYVRDMTEARDEADRLMDMGLQFIAQPTRFDPVRTVAADSRNIVVYNGSSWLRSDVVRLDPPDNNSRISAVRKGAPGVPVKFDTDADGHITFVAENVPAFGYASFDVTVSAQKSVSNLVSVKGATIKNDRLSVSVRPDGTISSIRDLKLDREIVNNAGERPFNDLLRVEGSDASVVTYPVPPVITVQTGAVISRISVKRPRSIFPLTTITLIRGLDQVEIHNELDPKYEGFVGGENFWGDSYYFAFPFDLSNEKLTVMRGGQKWFDKLPDDYLPGARKDSVSTQNMIAMTDGRSSALIAHRQAFHWAYAGYVPTKLRAKDAPAEFPAMYTGKFPLPEATMFSRALRNASEADTHDKGAIYIPSVEPGIEDNYIFDYAISAEGAFDPVSAWRMGFDFALPLRPEYTQVAPSELTKSYFSIDSPNVQIVNVKPLTDSVIRGEVSAAPLNPRLDKVFIIRLQEFAGRSAMATICLPIKIKRARLVSLTEDVDTGDVVSTEPLKVALRPYQTLSVRVEIE